MKRDGRAGSTPGVHDELSRREFARLLGASLALASGAGCTRAVPERIVPYVRQPPELTPGIARIYATSAMLDGYATGLLVECHEGRPTKIEGNPEHPASLGGSGVFEQALVLQLYDPDRARGPRRDADPIDWRTAIDRLSQPRLDRGAGLRLLLEPTSSPLTHALVQRSRARHPAMRVTFHAAGESGAALDGARAALGRALQPQYDFRRAQVVVALDADFLGGLPFRLRHARHFAGRRRGEGVRLYAVETMVSITGTMADERLRRPGRDVAPIAAALAAAAGGAGEGVARACAALGNAIDAGARRWAEAVARDLRRRPRGTTLILAGDRQPAAVHALAIAMNQALGNIAAAGEPAAAPLVFTAPVIPDGVGGQQDLAGLVGEMRAGRVDTLVMLGGNPAYDAPADLEWVDAAARVRETIYGGLYENETGQASRWFLPATHELESWGDGRAYDGTLSLVQPLIRPCMTAARPSSCSRRWPAICSPTAASWCGTASRRARSASGRRRWPPDSSRTAPSRRSARRSIRAASSERSVHCGPAHAGGFDRVGFYLVADGPRRALREQPLAARAAGADDQADLGQRRADEPRDGGRARRRRRRSRAGCRPAGAASHVPGAGRDRPRGRRLSLCLGYGRLGHGGSSRRRRLQRVPAAHPSRRRGSWPARRPQGSRSPRSGDHPGALGEVDRKKDEAFALRTTRAEIAHVADVTAEHRGEQPSFFEGPGSTAGMTPPVPGLRAAVGDVDRHLDVHRLQRVRGGVPGREQHAGRRPRAGEEQPRDALDPHRHLLQRRADNPRAVHQPMLCQHCEHAPCEYVCPVNATVHSPDGLNEMVYNRCVGTRFCSNNCPYKVRRFNWFDWKDRAAGQPGPGRAAAQPRRHRARPRRDGEVHATACSASGARRSPRASEQREIGAGEVVTACQQACPTQAIAFGSLHEADSSVARLRRDPRSYEVLHDLGTRPRTTYLARVDDPNAELRDDAIAATEPVLIGAPSDAAARRRSCCRRSGRAKPRAFYAIWRRPAR